ncbi:unnamed protein product [Mytilus coruscus]|uniref:Reverse transcriptase domain-containing protein n=1 Tax=Mytilus coruscus TaxID=42192 RepID=A0A6J8CQI5_MYTCO|nr:unnamed protein product [Mytilus coruscus]
MDLDGLTVTSPTKYECKSKQKRDQIPWEVIDDTGEVITDKECVLQKWKTDYQTLFNDQTDSMLYDECHLDRIKKGEISSDPELVDTSCLNAPITRYEVEKAVSRLKLRKAAGIDNIPAEVLKNKTCIDMLQKIINFCFENGVSPLEWKQGIINPIVKPNSTDVRLPLSYRWITLLSVPCKVYCDILNSRFGDWIEDSGVLVDEQCGFRRKRSCLDQIYSLYSIINDHDMYVLEITFYTVDKFDKLYRVDGKVYERRDACLSQPLDQKRILAWEEQIRHKQKNDELQEKITKYEIDKAENERKYQQLIAEKKEKEKEIIEEKCLREEAEKEIYSLQREKSKVLKENKTLMDK